jgi:four helix bundle protein
MVFAESLPRTRSAKVIVDQLLRCGSSVGANYRAACRAKSGRDMSAKLNTVLEEADEVQFWLELTVDLGLKDVNDIKLIHQEANEIISIMVASIQTLRRKEPIEESRNRGIE